MDGPNPSEKDTKVLIPAPSFCLQLEKRKFLQKWKKNKYGKLKMIWKQKTHGTSCSFHLSIPQLFCLQKWEKLVATLIYSSLRRVATSMLQRTSVFTSSSSQVRQALLKWGVNTGPFRFQYSTAAQQIHRYDWEVTRLVATEHERNKRSLFESLTPYCSSILLINWQRQPYSTVN